jgi:membrane-associated protein
MLNTLFDWLRSGGLPFLFLLIFIEANPIIGSFIPGQVIVIFVGFLISAANLYNLYYTLIVVLIASFLGDLFGYYLGKKYGFSGLKTFGLDDKSKIYKSSYAFFKKYGPWSIILGREFNFTRAFMPFFAGCFGMPLWSFVGFALFSCILWTILSIALGYYFGFIIVENFSFIMELIFFLLLYLFFVVFVYRNIKSMYYTNLSIVKRYALHNILFIGILMLLLSFMGYMFKWGYYQLFNDYFILLYFPGLYLIFGFLFTKEFLIIFALLILFLFLFKKCYRLLIVYIWSLVFFSLLTLVASLFFKTWYKINIYFGVVLFTILLFFLWIYVKKSINSKKYQFLTSVLIVSTLILMFLSYFSLNENLFLILFSFLIGVLETEFILVLSHYQILDNSLSECRFSIQSR